MYKDKPISPELLASLLFNISVPSIPLFFQVCYFRGHAKTILHKESFSWLITVNWDCHCTSPRTRICYSLQALKSHPFPRSEVLTPMPGHLTIMLPLLHSLVSTNSFGLAPRRSNRLITSHIMKNINSCFIIITCSGQYVIFPSSQSLIKPFGIHSKEYPILLDMYPTKATSFLV